MREALTEALQDYDGALVVVAHDRHLLRATTDALWLVADGSVAPFDGDLDDYRDWVLSRGGASRDDARAATTTRRAPRPQGAEARGGAGAAAAVRRAQAARSRGKSALEQRDGARSTRRRTALDAWLAGPTPTPTTRARR